MGLLTPNGQTDGRSCFTWVIAGVVLLVLGVLAMVGGVFDAIF